MPEHFVLAIFGGIGFGYISYRLGVTGERLAVLLFALYALSPLAQDIYRALDGEAVMDEFVLVTLIRFTQAIAAVAVSTALMRRRLRL